ncbi:MAG TPA: hypothetical protein VFM18_21530 [Methanosarcina sp.]|nr:hypothetical protein [Methanosarcina sp.]
MISRTFQFRKPLILLMDEYDFIEGGGLFEESGEGLEEQYFDEQPDEDERSDFEEDPFEGAGGNEDYTFDLDYERQRSLTYEKEGGTDYVEGINKRIQRLQQTPEDVYINQLRYQMSENLNLRRDDPKRAKIEDIARKRKDLVNLHPSTFLLAGLWVAQEKKRPDDPTKFKNFFNTYEKSMEAEVNEVDLYRYIRMLI